VRLVSPIGGVTGGSGNLSTTLSNIAAAAAPPKFVKVFNANCDGTIIYNDAVRCSITFVGNKCFLYFHVKVKVMLKVTVSSILGNPCKLVRSKLAKTE
jgi:hypothetical protein